MNSGISLEFWDFIKKKLEEILWGERVKNGS